MAYQSHLFLNFKIHSYSSTTTMLNKSYLKITILLLFVGFSSFIFQSKKEENNLNVIAYYSGDRATIDQYPVQKLTHIIFSFVHLKGNKISFDNYDDELTIKKLVGLKKENPNLKIQVALGGWAGCPSCSSVFSSEKGRVQFAESVKKMLDKHHLDGLDLDWEYPAIEGKKGHRFTAEDKTNFTLLVQEIRAKIGQKKELSFAAGGFAEFFDQSIEWDKVMPLVNRVNLMSYDLVNGNSTITGHHTPLYSTPEQEVSTDFGVNYLLKLGVPANKIVIGAAFYARVWENVSSEKNGLYQSGKFLTSYSYKDFDERLANFTLYKDTTSQSTYAYSETEGLFATFDDSTSVTLKTNYAINKKLGGIMFWELTGDKNKGGLLDDIYSAKVAATSK
jgi:chitinase